MKCMVVDDSKMSRMMLQKIIGSSHPDWDIVEAENGQKAIEMAKTVNHLDIILLDYNMPVMGGGEAAKILRPMFPKAKIAFLTANIQEAVKQEAQALNIDFIPKPITESKIVEYVG